MVEGTRAGVLGWLRGVGPEAPGASDAELLRCFTGEGDEQAFATLLRRHARLVYGLCRRLLRQEQDAEDAFQATFLVLARKAASIRQGQSLGGWLARVAVRIARQAGDRKEELHPLPEELTTPVAGAEAPGLLEEVERLGDDQRAVVVLCLVLGKTQAEAARELGCSPATVYRRLARARQLLQARLGRTLGEGALLLPACALPEGLLDHTAQAALLFASGVDELAPWATARAVDWTEGGLRMVGTTSLKGLIAAALGCLLLGLSAFLHAGPPEVPVVAPAAFALPALAPVEAPAARKAEVKPADLASVVRGNTAFAVEMFHEARAGAKGEKGLFFSPYSMTAALGMVQLGARGETAEEIARALHFTLPGERLHPALAAWREQLVAKKAGTPYQLEVVNSLWGQKDYSFRKDFLQASRDFYRAEIRPIDFRRDPNGARKEINQWVEKHTNAKVKGLLPPGSVTVDSRLALVNAIYFLGNWEAQFDPKQTVPAPFHLTAKESVNVPMMSMDHSFRSSHDKDAQVIELPYKGGALSMVLIVPRDKDGLARLEDGLTAARLQALLDELKGEPDRCSVSLPRFTLTTFLDLKPLLRSLGVSKAFAAGTADFSGIDGKRWLFIQTAVHKAFVDVNETGTEAAAATGIVFKGSSKPPSVRADRPFVFLIRDRRTGAILFLGRLVDPRW